MRSVIALAVLVSPLLAACTEASASRVDENTFRIEGPQMGIISEGPNRRMAARLCPKGYRVVESETHKGGPDRATDSTDPMTIWTIRCI